MLHWMNGIQQHFLVLKLFCHILTWNGVFCSTDWFIDYSFVTKFQSMAEERISERWSCASNYHHACEMDFTIRAGLQLNMSARQSLYLCNVVWTERNSLYFFSVDSLCLSQCQTAHPQSLHWLPHTYCEWLYLNKRPMWRHCGR